MTRWCRGRGYIERSLCHAVTLVPPDSYLNLLSVPATGGDPPTPSILGVYNVLTTGKVPQLHHYMTASTLGSLSLSLSQHYSHSHVH